MEPYKVRIYPDIKSPKLFKNRVLEALTWTHPLVITGMYVALGAYMIWLFNALNPHVGAAKISGIVAAAFFSWTLAEYFMHRFLYHKLHDATFSTGFQYVFHGIHHEYPNDEERLVLPPVPSILIAAVFFGFFYLIMGQWALVFGTGFLWGYLAYMLVHVSVHKFDPPKRFNFWWRHHNIHHFQQHDRAFGVTTSIWDRVFGTMPEPQRKTVEIEIDRSKKD
jgi:sterol desaturase/sphingolipid hydroxylase (fatty acid hydroxylase superfamily)